MLMDAESFVLLMCRSQLRKDSIMDGLPIRPEEYLLRVFPVSRVKVVFTITSQDLHMKLC